MIFGMPLHVQNLRGKLVYQGHRVKVKVKVTRAKKCPCILFADGLPSAASNLVSHISTETLHISYYFCPHFRVVLRVAA